MLRVLMGKVDNMKELKDTVMHRDENFKKEEMLGIKNTITDMKTAFDGLFSRVNTAEKKNL